MHMPSRSRDSSDNVNAVWITKYDPAGQKICSKVYARECNLGLACIQTTPEGEILVGGGYGQGYDGSVHLVFRVDTSVAMQWKMPIDRMFYPSTTIEFSIPSRGDVTLTVFDHLGRQVAVLADGEYRAGTHSYTFIGAELPSGV